MKLVWIPLLSFATPVDKAVVGHRAYCERPAILYKRILRRWRRRVVMAHIFILPYFLQSSGQNILGRAPLHPELGAGQVLVIPFQAFLLTK